MQDNREDDKKSVPDDERTTPPQAKAEDGNETAHADDNIAESESKHQPVETYDIEAMRAEEEEDDDEDEFSLSDDLVDEVIELIDHDYIDALHDIIAELSAPDIADLLTKLPRYERERLLDITEEGLDPEVYTYLPADIRNDYLDTLTAPQLAAVISNLDSDDALSLIAEFDEDRQQEILKSLSRRMRTAVEEGLAYPEESAGRLMQREAVAVPEYWTVGKTIDYIRAMGSAMPNRFYDIYVINNDHHVLGSVSLDTILRSPRGTRIEDAMRDDVRTIHVETDQEEVAFLFRRADLISAPVTDDNGRLVGVITIDDIVDVIDQEAQEDILRLGGIESSDINRSAFRTARSRSRWLAVNLLTAILSSIVIGFFEGTLKEIVALAVLMPIVASMGGNTGTQAMTVAIRSLATKELTASNTIRVVFKELWVGLMNGTLFAILIGIIAGLWFNSPMLGAVIGSAMVINLTIAGFFGVLIPITIHRLDVDPAPSAGVFLTTITDVIGFFAFLGLATIFLL